MLTRLKMAMNLEKSERAVSTTLTTFVKKWSFRKETPIFQAGKIK
jgi:hypothetical protein